MCVSDLPPRFQQQVTFLPVEDLARSVAFYAGVLGLEQVLDQGDCRVFGVAADAFVGVCERPGSGPSNGVMVTLVTDQVEVWHAHLMEHGVECDKAPAINEKYRLHHAFYRDPDGHIIEVQQFLDPQWPAPAHQTAR